MGANKKIKENVQAQVKDRTGDYKEKLLASRRQPTVLRLDRPSNLIRARSLGYKAKQGFVVAKVKVKRGSGMHTRPKAGRRPKRMGVNKLTRAKSKQLIAEERAQRRFPNLEVLNSYWTCEDGRSEWFEVILVDKSHASVKNDKQVAWTADPKNKKKVHRGRTRAGRKAAGKL
ncbi:50S ribosomal protein L15e [archaeon]|nr:50S ribosomal protein L15e [archaeon]